MKNQLLFPGITLALIVLFTSFACGDDDGLTEIVCPPFTQENFEYFPFQVGDVIRFADSLGEERRFQVESEFLFADTTYQSLIPEEVCAPFVEYVLSEQDVNNTLFTFQITETVSPVGVFLGINISDTGISGFPYFQQFLVEPTVNSSVSSDVTEVGALTINGTLYIDVILAELIQGPEFPDQFSNDVRRVWVARNAGVIQFEDSRRGIWSRLP